jgi:hypothetical protein
MGQALGVLPRGVRRQRFTPVVLISEPALDRPLALIRGDLGGQDVQHLAPSLVRLSRWTR